MIEVRIIKNWEKPDLFRQTPKELGMWEDIQFTFKTIADPDYVLVLNCSPKKVKVKCPKENVWCILQEPPNEYFKYWHKGDKVYYRVFTQDLSLTGERYIHSQPALSWHIEKSYDELTKCIFPDKPLDLSFITSSKTSFVGQRERIKFLEKLRNKIEFDLFGYGFSPIADKWNGLAPYKYSLVVENYHGPDYWSEKLADCFLAFTMPIYYGCTNIADYFPVESLVEIDINNPNVIEDIRKIIRSDLWKKKREAILQARDLLLNKYQFFPYFVEHIHDWERKKNSRERKKESIVIPRGNTLFQRLKLNIKRMTGSLL